MPIQVQKRNPVEVDETKAVEVTAVSDLDEGVVVLTAGAVEIVLDADAASDLAQQIDDAVQELSELEDEEEEDEDGDQED